jgi:uncharacterized protein DUF4154
VLRVFAYCRELMARKGKLRAERQEWKGRRAGQQYLSIRNRERMFARGRAAQSLGIILVLLAASLSMTAQSSVPTEYRTKANFLAMVPSFIDWPEDAFSSAQAPFLVCVLGDFSFGITLARAVQSVSPHGRRVEIQQRHKDQELRSCHVLFVSRSEATRYEKVFQAVQGADVLTVGETPDFLSVGGALSFSFQHEALQFEVNLSAANSAHLKVSSRLLALARRVLNNPEAAKV